MKYGCAAGSTGQHDLAKEQYPAGVRNKSKLDLSCNILTFFVQTVTDDEHLFHDLMSVRGMR